MSLHKGCSSYRYFPCDPAAKFGLYELEEDTLKDLAEFSLANAIYAALAEGHAAEINSKQNAMDNASKNAGEMITNLGMGAFLPDIILRVPSLMLTIFLLSIQ